MAVTGRPSSYKPEYVEQAEKLCALGATDVELADFFGVERTTIWRWSVANEDFCNALKAGKAAADERVAQSLYHKAIGYTFDSVKIMTRSLGENAGSVIEQVPFQEHVPPDTTAAIFWLKNRRPQEWRDRREHEHTGKDGKDLVPEPADPARAAQALLGLMHTALNKD